LVLMEKIRKGKYLFGFGPGILISKIRKDHFLPFLSVLTEISGR
jgi:hypothetical protein